MTKTREMLIVASKTKETVHAAGCMTSAELMEALSNLVHDKLERAIERAKANGRTTVRPCDL